MIRTTVWLMFPFRVIARRLAGPCATHHTGNLPHRLRAPTLPTSPNPPSPTATSDFSALPFIFSRGAFFKSQEGVSGSFFLSFSKPQYVGPVHTADGHASRQSLSRRLVLRQLRCAQLSELVRMR